MGIVTILVWLCIHPSSFILPPFSMEIPMASTNFLPDRESDLLTWSVNFDTKITASPTDYGLTADQATAYGTLHSAFADAYQTANNPDTRSPSNIVAKDVAKDALINNARMLARIVQATPAVTPEQKSELGLTVRDVEPTPIPPPASWPKLEIVAVNGRTVQIRLSDLENPTRRGKPEGVSGATVLSFVGEEAPSDPGLYKFEGNTSRTTASVEFPITVAEGAKVWLTAFWFNNRKQSGPACEPVGTNLQIGGAMAA
jgi:hypothetical protein